ncbi:MAG TPA: hypothetical protein PKN75_07160 [Bacteroidia bacterium]|nr:hypothetical protein [Bacteroidia bacterium]HNU33355.1 hypothetical protein [Bacteroidia bacterium]
MECYSGTGILLLAIIAALFFLLKNKNENGNTLLKWVAWLCIVISFICISCMFYNCWYGGCCYNGAGMEESCSIGKNCGMEEEFHCCEDDSLQTMRVMIDSEGDTVKIEKHIKVLKETDKKE